MSSSAGHRMKQAHTLNFFHDKDHGSALTVLVNGVRFHAYVDFDKIKPAADQDNKAAEEYSKLIKTLEKSEKQSEAPHHHASKEPEAEYEEEDKKDTQDIYCICRGPDNGFMIGCDSCDEWFHGECVGISRDEGASMDKYTCPNCQKGTRSPTAASRDSGVVLEDEDSKGENDPEEALQTWILSHLEAEIDEHAPSRNEMKTTNVHDWYHPPTHFYSLEPNNKNTLQPKELESSPSLRFRMKNLLPTVTLPKYILNLNIPWYQASDLEILEDSGTTPTLVRDSNKTLYFLKVVDPSQPGPTKRELKILKDIEKADLHKEMRVPQVHGLVSFSDSKMEMMGFLQTHIQGAEPLTHLLDSDIPQSKRDGWASESEKMVELLHDHNLVWGDAKADNFMVDKEDKLWIIDFGGSYTEGWVDPELKETEEGDDMGTSKIVNALHDPDANTFDLDDTTVAEQQGVKRSRETEGREGKAGKKARVD